MVLGDGIRRNLADVHPEEIEIFRNAFLDLHERHFEGLREESPAGGVSYWFKQDEIHQGTHVHGGPAFLTWHRELCNQLEALFREEVSPKVSLHYWDWNDDPEKIILKDESTLNLLSENFFGKPRGKIGEPWETKKFYDPAPDGEKYRSDNPEDVLHSNPFDPPQNVWRRKPENLTLKSFAEGLGRPFYEDEDITNASNFKDMRTKLEHNHDLAHGYIGGSIGLQHTAFRDPFVFLIHSNVDRLFAEWQYKDKDNRLNPDKVYGQEAGDDAIIVIDEFDPSHVDIQLGIMTEMAPWNGSLHPNMQIQNRLKKVRPWAEPENWHIKYRDKYVMNSKHPSVVNPRKYDTLV